VEPCCTCGAQDAMDEITRLTTENKDKNEEIEKLASHLLAIDNYCRVNDIDIEQALKGE